MDKFLQAVGYYTVEILQKLALVQAVWIGSPMGQAVIPYFAKAPEQIQVVAKQVAKASPLPRCIKVEGRKVCEK